MGNLLQGKTLIRFAREIQSAPSLRGSLKDSSMGRLPDGQWLLDALDAKHLRRQKQKTNDSLNRRQKALIKGSTLILLLQQMVALSALPASYFLMAKFWAWSSRNRSKS